VTTGAQFEGNRINAQWTVDGHWTVQLENEGNSKGRPPTARHGSAW
jgi:hypothetical protein